MLLQFAIVKSDKGKLSVKLCAVLGGALEVVVIERAANDETEKPATELLLKKNAADSL